MSNAAEADQREPSATKRGSEPCRSRQLYPAQPPALFYRFQFPTFHTGPEHRKAEPPSSAHRPFRFGGTGNRMSQLQPISSKAHASVAHDESFLRQNRPCSEARDSSFADPRSKLSKYRPTTDFTAPRNSNEHIFKSK